MYFSCLFWPIHNTTTTPLGYSFRNIHSETKNPLHIPHDLDHILQMPIASKPGRAALQPLLGIVYEIVSVRLFRYASGSMTSESPTRRKHMPAPPQIPAAASPLSQPRLSTPTRWPCHRRTTCTPPSTTQLGLHPAPRRASRRRPSAPASGSAYHKKPHPRCKLCGKRGPAFDLAAKSTQAHTASSPEIRFRRDADADTTNYRVNTLSTRKANGCRCSRTFRIGVLFFTAKRQVFPPGRPRSARHTTRIPALKKPPTLPSVRFAPGRGLLGSDAVGYRTARSIRESSAATSASATVVPSLTCVRLRLHVSRPARSKA
eukprot:2346647-Rhodomonas_salina.2